MSEVYEFLNSLNISCDMPLVVGVSYGPDSMFLLDLLSKYFNRNKVICAHVHHNHRKESDEEASKLETYCKKNNITFEFMKIDSYNDNKFTEEEARVKRYDFFESLLKKYNSHFLFTAHHGDDLVETVLMRLVRGSNVKGYSGISLIDNRENYKLVRPLLYLTKEDILNYCDENSIPYAVDITNYSDEQTRNRYRNKVLKFLKEENKNVHQKFLSFSNKLKEYDDFISDYSINIYKNVVKNNIIDVHLLNEEKDVIIKKVIEIFLHKNYKNDIKLLEDKHVVSILNMIKSEKSNDKISLPLKKNLIKSYNKIYFDNDIMYNDYCIILDEYSKLPNGYVIKMINERENNSNYITLLDSNELKMPLYVRNRLDGDKMEVLNMKGSKKIKDILIDEKIDMKTRRNYPVVVDFDGNIVWLPGIKKSKYDKSKQGKYDIILKYVKEKNYE